MKSNQGISAFDLSSMLRLEGTWIDEELQNIFQIEVQRVGCSECRGWYIKARVKRIWDPRGACNWQAGAREQGCLGNKGGKE